MNNDHSSPFQEPQATELAHRRIKARQVRRITYDCLSTVVRDDRVVCRQGHTFPLAGSRRVEGLPLLVVLCGRSSSVCQKCLDYDGEEGE